MADEIPAEDIVAAATGPMMTRTVEGTIQERSVGELIAADRYAAAKTVTAVPWGLYMARCQSGGTVGNRATFNRRRGGDEFNQV